MPDRGHFQRLRPLIGGLADEGARVYVCAHRRFGAEVAAAGGELVDLFSRHSIEEADDESWPLPLRYVTFAARYAEAISREVRALRPSLIVHDTFAVIGGVVARTLALPHVNICAGHAAVPERLLPVMDALPIVKVSAACHTAVEQLRTQHGLTDASPFSYISALSPHLNLYCEPPQFLDDADRPAFEPIAFYGSLPTTEPTPATDDVCRGFGDTQGDVLKMYASFGTAIWDYCQREAVAALSAVVDALEHERGIRVLISLGGERDPEIRAQLQRPNVRVESYVDQWSVLREADVFLTHHGLNSTHEAIYQRVPMISYPFVYDQPGQARKCQRLGVATPLTSTRMGAVSRDDVIEAVARIRERRQAFEAALDRVRAWEQEVLAARPRVHRQMLAL